MTVSSSQPQSSTKVIPANSSATRIGQVGPRVAILPHQVDLVVLEADDLFGLQLDPAREEGRAMGAMLDKIVSDADAGSGRFGPRQFDHAIGKADYVYPLILHPSAADESAMDAMAKRAVVLEAHLVQSAVFVGVESACLIRRSRTQLKCRQRKKRVSAVPRALTSVPIGSIKRAWIAAHQ